MTKTETSDAVIVSGQVASDGDDRVIVPARPPEIPPRGNHLAVRLIGSDLPPVGILASVSGDLSGYDLHVSGWLTERLAPHLWESAEQVGVASRVSHDTLASIPGHWELISTGERKFESNRWIAIAHLVRQTADVVPWLAAQTPNSILVYPYIRQADSGTVLTAQGSN